MYLTVKRVTLAIGLIWTVLCGTVNWAEAMSAVSENTDPKRELRCEMAQGKDRDPQGLAALCSAMRDNVPQVLPEAQEVTLVMERLAPHHLRGYFRWRLDTGDQRGPSVTFGVQDVPLSAAMYGRFIEAIVQATPDLFDFGR